MLPVTGLACCLSIIVLFIKPHEYRTVLTQDISFALPVPELITSHKFYVSAVVVVILLIGNVCARLYLKFLSLLLQGEVVIVHGQVYEVEYAVSLHPELF